MKTNKIFLLLLIFSIPLALATTVSTQLTYAPDQLVTITGSCQKANAPVALQASLNGNTVWFTETASQDNLLYSTTFLPPQQGTYTIYSACNGETTVTTSFEVKPLTATEIPTPPTAEVTGGSGGGGGGSGGCRPDWDCSSYWTICNATLQQSRQCTNLNRCQPYQKEEVRSCEPCPESWTCSLWSECSDGQQSRVCVDENYCQTDALKPIEQKACGQPDYGAQPFQIIQQPPETFVLPKPEDFFSKYQIWFIVVPAALIVLLLLFFLILHFVRKKRVVYNHDELVQWIQQEMQTGTAKDDIIQILKQNTGWTDEEIMDAFDQLQVSGNTK